MEQKFVLKVRLMAKFSSLTVETEQIQVSFIKYYITFLFYNEIELKEKCWQQASGCGGSEGSGASTMLVVDVDPGGFRLWEAETELKERFCLKFCTDALFYVNVHLGGRKEAKTWANKIDSWLIWTSGWITTPVMMLMLFLMLFLSSVPRLLAGFHRAATLTFAPAWKVPVSRQRFPATFAVSPGTPLFSQHATWEWSSGFSPVGGAGGVYLLAAAGGSQVHMWRLSGSSAERRQLGWVIFRHIDVPSAAATSCSARGRSAPGFTSNQLVFGPSLMSRLRWIVDLLLLTAASVLSTPTELNNCRKKIN